jgi:hypothetical protein
VTVFAVFAVFTRAGVFAIFAVFTRAGVFAIFAVFARAGVLGTGRLTGLGLTGCTRVERLTVLALVDLALAAACAAKNALLFTFTSLFVPPTPGVTPNIIFLFERGGVFLLAVAALLAEAALALASAFAMAQDFFRAEVAAEFGFLLEVMLFSELPELIFIAELLLNDLPRAVLAIAR